MLLSDLSLILNHIVYLKTFKKRTRNDDIAFDTYDCLLIFFLIKKKWSKLINMISLTNVSQFYLVL